MNTTIEVAETGLALRCDYTPIYNYAAVAGQQHPVRSIAVEPTRASNKMAGELRVSIPEISYDLSLQAEALLAKSKWPPVGMASEVELERITTRLPVHLEVALDGKSLARFPVTLVPCWQWPHYREARILAAGYVLPGDEVVSRMLTAASSRSSAGAVSLSTRVRKSPGEGAREALESIYTYLAEDCDISYETPQMEHDEWCSASYQKVRSPQDIFFFAGQRKGRGNCLDLTLFFASCLESLGLHPLVMFTGTLDSSPAHAFLGCWSDNARRFRPFLTDGKQLAREVASGRLLVLEATGVSQGSMALSFEEATRAGREHLAKGAVHALDISASRPPLGVVRPVMLENAPLVQLSLWVGQEFAHDRKSKLYETLHILYGMCAVRGELTTWLLKRSGGSAEAVKRVIEVNLPKEEHPGPPVATKNYEICVNTARGNARSEGRSSVEEVDLLWAVIENPSRNIARILEAGGCDYAALVQELDAKFKRPGEMSLHRHVRSDAGP